MSRFINYYQKPIKCEVELKMFPQSDINLIGFNALSLWLYYWDIILKWITLGIVIESLMVSHKLSK